ncbi:MAG TPA: hypothetical protein VEL76_33810 [Gemmataceae bacterium]|nr:hypothetical protein [Gemmataceae bacterium]
MPIPVICSCSAKLKVGDHLDGKHIKCPKCGSLIPVGTAANGKAATPAAKPKPAPTRNAADVLAESGLSAEERDRLEGELDRGEQLLWAGKPVARSAFMRGWGVGAGFLFGAIIMIVALIVMWNHGVFHDSFGTIMALILGGGIAGCVVFGIAWPYLQRWYAGRTVYAVTTKRALAWVCNYFGKTSLVSYQPADMVKLSRSDIKKGDDGIGHLVFGVTVRTTRTSDGIIRSYRSYGFFLVHRPLVVERLLREYLIDPFIDAAYDD